MDGYLRVFGRACQSRWAKDWAWGSQREDKPFKGLGSADVHLASIATSGLTFWLASERPNVQGSKCYPGHTLAPHDPRSGPQELERLRCVVHHLGYEPTNKNPEKDDVPPHGEPPNPAARWPRQAPAQPQCDEE